MTREKAIKIMRKEIECLSHSRCRDCILEKVCDPNTNPTDDEYIEAFGMAINSLEIDERYELEYENADEIHREREQAYMQGYEDACKKYRQEPILDKIRAEILEEKECAYADFERYKVEYLGQDWEDALDSLPQDDFRYGMERAVEIIDKYKAESEEVNDTDI